MIGRLWGETSQMQVTPDGLCARLVCSRLAHGYQIAMPHQMTAKDSTDGAEKQPWNSVVPSLWKVWNAGRRPGSWSCDESFFPLILNSGHFRSSSNPKSPQLHLHPTTPLPRRLLQPNSDLPSTLPSLWSIPKGDNPQLPLPRQIPLRQRLSSIRDSITSFPNQTIT